MEQCCFQLDEHFHCKELKEEGSNFCFFHDPRIPKNTPQARERILSAISAQKKLNGAYLAGADLSRADLRGAWLIKADLRKANLERSNLEGGHLYNANLAGANLFNATLRGANIKETNLEGANLLEIKIDDAKIFGIEWGRDEICQTEKDAHQAACNGDHKQAKLLYREAEEIYLNIRARLLMAGDFRRAGDFFYRSMVTRRKQMPLFSFKRFASKVIDLLCGYGEKAARIFFVAAAFIVFNSFLYFIFGVKYWGSLLAFNAAHDFSVNFQNYLLTLYYSVITCTTTGYGDITPLGISRLFAAIEAFFGSFLIALFVIVFGRKMLQ